MSDFIDRLATQLRESGVLDGQQRTAWLYRQLEPVAEAAQGVQHYVPPNLRPVTAAIPKGAMMFSPGADMYDAMVEHRKMSDAVRKGEGWNALGAAAGMGAAMLGMAVPGTAKGYGEATEEAVDGVRAFHGSPHDFDKFSTAHIGTGEGAQAFGHGLYFAGNEGVARSYRNALSGSELKIDGVNLGVTPPRGVQPRGVAPVTEKLIALRDAGVITQEQLMALKHLYGSGSIDDAIAEIRRIAPNQVNPERFEKIADTLEGMKDRVAVGTNGHMYEVRIRANEDDFLDWDAPFSAQSATVRDGLSGVGLRPREFPDEFGSPVEASVGTDLRAVNRDVRYAPGDGYQSQAEFYDRLRDAGIPGIRYLDQGSRRAGEGSRNYVVFDDSIVDILRKYGIAAPVAAAGGAAGYNALSGENYQAENGQYVPGLAY